MLPLLIGASIHADTYTILTYVLMAISIVLFIIFAAIPSKHKKTSKIAGVFTLLAASGFAYCFFAMFIELEKENTAKKEQYQQSIQESIENNLDADLNIIKTTDNVMYLENPDNLIRYKAEYDNDGLIGYMELNTINETK